MTPDSPIAALLVPSTASLDVTAHVTASIVPAVLDVIGQRWSLAIIQTLLLQEQSFGQLLVELSIPRSTLAARLKHLQAMGCLEAGPAGYRLTAAGQALLPVVSLAQAWDALRGLLPAAPLRHQCTELLQPSLVCGHCLLPIRVADIHLDSAGVAPTAADLRKPARRARAEFSAQTKLTAAEILGDRWTALIVALIYFGVQRYSDIERHLSIAPNILADRLLRLSEGGVLVRELEVQSRRPLYRFSREGLQLFPLIVALTWWGDHWLRPDYSASTLLRHKPCGQRLQPQLCCACCGLMADLCSLSVG
jgi:DNA-binding HxlR family transcriptional regulator